MSGATVAEGDSATVTVRLSKSWHSAVSVTVSTSDATATAGADYTRHSQRVTISSGRRTATVTIATLDDSVHEHPTAHETIRVRLSSVRNGRLGSSRSTTISIINNDPITLALGGSSVSEGERIRFTLTPSEAPLDTASVSWELGSEPYQEHPSWADNWCPFSPVGDYNTANNNYSGILTWNAGDGTAKEIAVNTCQDSRVEDNEDVILAVNNPVYFEVPISSHTAQILNDDIPNPDIPDVDTATFFVDSPTVVEGGDLEFTVTLAGTIGRANVTIATLTTGTGTRATQGVVYQCSAAQADDDFIHYGSSRTIWGGDTFTVRVKTCDDELTEREETVIIRLTPNSRVAYVTAVVDGDGTAVGTIYDNDTPEVYLDGDARRLEGAALEFTVRLLKVSPVDVTVTLSTEDDPAATHPANATGAARDYQTQTSHQVTIPAGNTEATASVSTVSDSTDEYNETFALRIDAANSSIGANVGSPAQAVGTIIDNDRSPTVNISDGVAIEGNGRITFDVSLSTASAKTITVTATTGPYDPISAVAATSCVADDGTEDYRSKTELLTFQPGQTSKTFTVVVCDDTADEDYETFWITLLNAANATLGTSTASATITDDDSSAEFLR